MFKRNKYKKYEVIYTINNIKYTTTDNLSDITVARIVANSIKKQDKISKVSILEITTIEKVIKL